jgi:hypothetical protein
MREYFAYALLTGVSLGLIVVFAIVWVSGKAYIGESVLVIRMFETGTFCVTFLLGVERMVSFLKEHTARGK